MTCRVAVLGGGISPERGVSLGTARAVVTHLPREAFDPVPVEILVDGRWRYGDAPAGPVEAALARMRSDGIECVFIGLHGAGGEDGTVQGLLESAGFAYTGSGVAASALAMDKARTRDVLAARGMPMAAGLEFSGTDPGPAAAEVLRVLGDHVVVKDPCGGSSIGVEIAKGAAEVSGALAVRLRSRGARALVEKYVAGREMSCPVLGNSSRGAPAEALPPILIRPLRSEWFDFRTKYDPDRVDELCPAPVEPEIRQRVADAAVLAHRALRCDGLTRSDFIVPEDGVPRFLEINTLPGLTEASLCPKAARAAGLGFPEFLRRLVLLAEDRFRPAEDAP